MNIIMKQNLCLIKKYKLFISLLFIVSNIFTIANAGDKFDDLSFYDKNFLYYPGDKWQKIDDPTKMGWSNKKLRTAKEYSNSIHSDAVVIIQNGVIVDEWGKTNKRLKLHSVRKSIMSLMYGIGVDRGRIDIKKTLKELGIDDRKKLTKKEKKATIQNLLQARSGIYHPAAYETKRMTKKRPKRGKYKPGTHWFYNNWDFNALLTIYHQLMKQDFFKSFKKEIAEPLQLERFRLKDTKYHYERHHSEHPAYRFKMTALDLARIGLLVLREGRWKDKQLVSKSWIEESTKIHSIIKKKNPDRGYGYMWWYDEGVIYGSGTGGQRLFVVPALDLVVVHRVNTYTKKRLKSKKIWKLYSKIIKASPSYQ